MGSNRWRFQGLKLLGFDVMLWDVALGASLMIGFILVVFFRFRGSPSESETPSKTRFISVIIGKGSKNVWKDERIEGDSTELKIGSHTYRGSVHDSWFTRYGWIGRRLNPEDGCHLLIFHEGVSQPVIHGTPPDSTSKQLMTAQRYRGVNPALREQFIEKSALDIPWWALVIALVVFIIVVLVVADKQGWLRLVFK